MPTRRQPAIESSWAVSASATWAAAIRRIPRSQGCSVRGRERCANRRARAARRTASTITTKPRTARPITIFANCWPGLISMRSTSPRPTTGTRSWSSTLAATAKMSTARSPRMRTLFAVGLLMVEAAGAVMAAWCRAVAMRAGRLQGHRQSVLGRRVGPDQIDQRPGRPALARSSAICRPNRLRRISIGICGSDPLRPPSPTTRAAAMATSAPAAVAGGRTSTTRAAA